MLDIIAWVIIWVLATIASGILLSGHGSHFFDDIKASVFCQMALLFVAGSVSAVLWAINRIWGL